MKVEDIKVGGVYEVADEKYGVWTSKVEVLEVSALTDTVTVRYPNPNLGLDRLPVSLIYRLWEGQG